MLTRVRRHDPIVHELLIRPFNLGCLPIPKDPSLTIVLVSLRLSVPKVTQELFVLRGSVGDLSVVVRA